MFALTQVILHIIYVSAFAVNDFIGRHQVSNTKTHQIKYLMRNINTMLKTSVNSLFANRLPTLVGSEKIEIPFLNPDVVDDTNLSKSVVDYFSHYVYLSSLDRMR